LVKAVTSLDQVTQQNASLVEEAASAAETLNEEAQMLDRMMANYQIAGSVSSRAALPERRKAGRPSAHKPRAPQTARSATGSPASVPAMAMAKASGG